MKTEDEIKDLARQWAERFTDELLANEFRPAILWTDKEDRLRLVAHPQIASPERGPIYWAVNVLSSAQADVGAITFIHDSYTSQAQTKKDGTAWGPGGMQYAVENNTEDAELVRDCFSYQVVDSEGVMAMASLPYTKTDAEVTFLWDEFTVYIEGGDAKFEGHFPDILRGGIQNAGTVTSKVAPMATMMGLDEPTASAHLLAIAVKTVMQELQWPCQIAVYDKEVAEVLQRSFKSGPLSEGLAMFNEDQMQEIVQLEEAFNLPDAIPNK